MDEMQLLQQNLEERGYRTAHFATAAQAADYLDREIDGTSVAFGGSVTVQEMGLYDRLGSHNKVFWHWAGDTREQARQARVFITSLNAVAQSGELINIDGTGNRVSESLYGHERVYFVVGANKVAADFDQALWRARNVAAPKNAQRLGLKTPCAARGDKCYNCKSPDRICQALVVLWGRPNNGARYEVVLVDQTLGY